MIALDTNAMVRMLVEDDPNQSRTVQKLVIHCEKNKRKILILPEVLIESVWVLESVYKCSRQEIRDFLDVLVSTSSITFPDPSVIIQAVRQYSKKGDFADLVMVAQAKRHNARYLFSFDRKLQKWFPDFVVEKIES